MKVPQTPPDRFVLDESLHVRGFGEVLWRVFRTTGPHATTWNQLRHFGPLREMRFDPHPPPAQVYPETGVMYTATWSHTAIGEVFQSTRVIDRAMGGRTIAAWIPSRPLNLLDLTTNWPVLNGAAAAMMMDDKSTTQAWARAIDERFGDELDGLYHQSSINNQPLVTLFSRTERVPAFPARPSFSALLSDTTADEIVAKAMWELGYQAL